MTQIQQSPVKRHGEVGRRPQPTIAVLEDHARRRRKQFVRMVAKVGIGYLPQGLGAADIFAALYLGELRLDEADPNWSDRDRLVLSTRLGPVRCCHTNKADGALSLGLCTVANGLTFSSRLR